MATNNQELVELQTAQHLEQEQLVGYWIKRFGLTRRDLESHPQIDDLMFLIKFRAEFWDMNRGLKSKYFKAWDWVYNKHLPLKKNHLNNLHRIGTTIIKWRKNRQEDIKLVQAFRKKHLG
jgi:hypothetical protein